MAQKVDLVSLIETLERSNDDNEILVCLVELCHLLAMSTEDSLSTLPSKQTVSCLTRLISGDHFTSDIVLHSCRALHYFIDVSPRSLSTVVEAVPALLEKLQVVEYIDIAEHSLQVLELISRKHEEPILKKNGISSCLKFLDFLSEPAQRKALTIVCNCCKGVVNAHDFTYVKSSIDILTSRLLNQDKKSVESVCLCFRHLIENLSRDESCLKQIANEDFFNKLQQLLMITPTVMTSTTYNNILNMLNVVCCSSFHLKLLLLQSKISETLLYLLIGSKKDASAALHIELTQRSSQETFETVNLISNLLPPLPHSVTNDNHHNSQDPLNQLFSINDIVNLSLHHDNQSGDVTGEDGHGDFHWQYLDEKGVWKNYASGDDDIIEMSYMMGESEINILSNQASNIMLNINFLSMQQNHSNIDNKRSTTTTSSTSTFSKSTTKSSLPSVTPIRRVYFKEKGHSSLTTTSQQHRKLPLGSSRTTTTTTSTSTTMKNINITSQHATLLNELITTLLPVVYEIFISTASLAVKYKCLDAMLKMVQYSDALLLREVLKSVPISSLIANMLTSSDSCTLVSSIQLSHLLMQKLPDIFDIYFRRQGVVHQMAQLAQTGLHDVHNTSTTTTTTFVTTATRTITLHPDVSNKTSTTMTKEMPRLKSKDDNNKLNVISKYNSKSSSSLLSSSSVMYAKGTNNVHMKLVSSMSPTSSSTSSSTATTTTTLFSTSKHSTMPTSTTQHPITTGSSSYIDVAHVKDVTSSTTSMSTTTLMTSSTTTTTTTDIVTTTNSQAVTQMRIADVLRSKKSDSYNNQSSSTGSNQSTNQVHSFRSSTYLHHPQHHHQSMPSIHRDDRRSSATFNYGTLYNYHQAQPYVQQQPQLPPQQYQQQPQQPPQQYQQQPQQPPQQYQQQPQQPPQQYQQQPQQPPQQYQQQPQQPSQQYQQQPQQPPQQYQQQLQQPLQQYQQLQQFYPYQPQRQLPLPPPQQPPIQPQLPPGTFFPPHYKITFPLQDPHRPIYPPHHYHHQHPYLAGERVTVTTSSSSSSSTSSSRHHYSVPHSLVSTAKSKLFGAKDQQSKYSAANSSTTNPSTTSTSKHMFTKTFLANLNPAKWGKFSGSSSSMSSNKNTLNVKKAPSTANDLVSHPVVNSHELINQWVIQHASSFLDKYFSKSTSHHSSSHPSINILNQLSDIMLTLGKIGQDGLANDLDQLTSLSHLIAHNDISPFELIQSNFVELLISYLNFNLCGDVGGHDSDVVSTVAESVDNAARCADVKVGGFGDDDGEKSGGGDGDDAKRLMKMMKMKMRNDRLRMFLHTFFGCPKEEYVSVTTATTTLTTTKDTKPLYHLVAKLITCFHHVEKFVVKTKENQPLMRQNRHHTTTTTMRDGVGRHVAMVRHASDSNNRMKFCRGDFIEVKLRPHPSCTLPPNDWKVGRSRIDPFVTVQSLEKYIMRNFKYIKLSNACIDALIDDDDEYEDDDDSDDDDNDDDDDGDGGGGGGDDRGDTTRQDIHSKLTFLQMVRASAGEKSPKASLSSPSSPVSLSAPTPTLRGFQFYIGNHLIPRGTTIYQAVKWFSTAQPPPSSSSSSSTTTSSTITTTTTTISHLEEHQIWTLEHIIWFKPVYKDQQPTTTMLSSSLSTLTPPRMNTSTIVLSKSPSTTTTTTTTTTTVTKTSTTVSSPSSSAPSATTSSSSTSTTTLTTMTITATSNKHLTLQSSSSSPPSQSSSSSSSSSRQHDSTTSIVIHPKKSRYEDHDHHRHRHHHQHHPIAHYHHFLLPHHHQHLTNASRHNHHHHHHSSMQSSALSSHHHLHHDFNYLHSLLNKMSHHQQQQQQQLSVMTPIRHLTKSTNNFDWHILNHTHILMNINDPSRTVLQLLIILYNLLSDWKNLYMFTDATQLKLMERKLFTDHHHGDKKDIHISDYTINRLYWNDDNDDDDDGGYDNHHRHKGQDNDVVIDDTDDDLRCKHHHHASEFISNKLTSKVTKQLHDSNVLVFGCLPHWVTDLALACPFLLSFEVRCRLFWFIGVDKQRAINKFNEQQQHLQQQQHTTATSTASNSNQDSTTVNKISCNIEKVKRSIKRSNLLEQAEIVMKEMIGSNAILEIQFFEEAGFGLGPTLEFYTLVSQQLQLYKHHIWVGSSNDGDVDHGGGRSGDVIESKNFNGIVGASSSGETIDGLNDVGGGHDDGCKDRPVERNWYDDDDEEEEEDNDGGRKIDEDNNGESPMKERMNDVDDGGNKFIADDDSTRDKIPDERELHYKVNKNNEEDGDDVYIHPPSSFLFPKPIRDDDVEGEEVVQLLNKFEFLGRFMAKSLVDSRFLDLPLSLCFYKWLLGEELTLNLNDLKYVDRGMYDVLSKMQCVVDARKIIENDPQLPPSEKHQQIQSLTMDGSSIDDLCLTFTLPGHLNFDLIPGGSEIMVTIDNLQEYVQRCVYWLLIGGVQRQMSAVRLGFESFLPLSSLRLFYAHELDNLFCGTTNDHNPNAADRWTPSYLMGVCRTDHGYSQDSTTVHHLYNVMSSFSGQRQRSFIQFITGSPRLPIGGLKSLKPPLTVVRRQVEPGSNSDDYLPSVMTCVNYLKLPNYSNVDILREKLTFAMNEGRLSFHLS